MKDIKSILIGVFATTCLFLFMGNAENDKQVDESKIASALNDINLTLIEGNKNGRYQITAEADNDDIWLVDTQTARLYELVFDGSDYHHNWEIVGKYRGNFGTEVRKEIKRVENLFKSKK